MAAPELTYTFYSTTYGGTLDEEAYQAASSRAAARLTALVGTDIPDRVSDAYLMAACALVDRVAGADTSGTLKSETVGSTSFTYTDAVANATDLDAVRPYLANTGLLFRGVSCR